MKAPSAEGASVIHIRARWLSVAYIDVKTASIAEWLLSLSSLQP